MTTDHFLPNADSEMTLLMIDLLCLLIGVISISFFISNYILIMSALSITLTVAKKIYDFFKKTNNDKREP